MQRGKHPATNHDTKELQNFTDGIILKIALLKVAMMVQIKLLQSLKKEM